MLAGTKPTGFTAGSDIPREREIYWISENWLSIALRVDRKNDTKSSDSNICQKRQWQPTPVLLPRKSHGWRSLVGCSPWGAKSRTRLSDFTFTFPFRHWRRKWQPTPGFLTGESQGQGCLAGCRLWGCTESDMTEVT